MKYNLHLVGFPQDVICDPSDLSVSELFALRNSLEKGTCTFEHLPDADRVALQATVEEQEKNGENPWGKRKRRSDAGKPKKPNKKGKLSESTVRHGSTCPPSDSDEDTPNGDIRPEIGLGQPRKIVHKRALNAPKVAQCSSSMSTTATASSIAHVAGIAEPRVSTTPSTGVGATTTAHSEESTQLTKALPARGFVDSSDGSEGSKGGEEFESEDDGDDEGPIPYCEGSP